MSLYTRSRRRSSSGTTKLFAFLLLWIAATLFSGWWWMLLAGFVHAQILPDVIPFGYGVGVGFSLFFSLAAVGLGIVKAIVND